MRLVQNHHILTQDDLKTTQVVKVELQYITDKNFFLNFTFLNFIKKLKKLLRLKIKIIENLKFC